MGIQKQPTAKTPARRRSIFAERSVPADAEDAVGTYLDSFTEDSQRTMRAALESVADILSDGRVAAHELAWHALRPQHTSRLRGRLLKLYAPSTANRYLSALRGVLKEAWRLGLVDRETMERTIDVAPIRGKREPHGRSVSRQELRAVFLACAQDENPAAAARDAAVLALLYGTGIRRSEAAAAQLSDLSLSKGVLRVLGKGNKQRSVYLPAGTVGALDAWLQIRGTGATSLLTQVSKNGTPRASRGITGQLIYHIVRKRHLLAGVEPFTPHDLRRSFISELLDDGVDIATVAKQVGHSNVQTTARYDRREEVAQQRGVLRHDVPFG